MNKEHPAEEPEQQPPEHDWPPEASAAPPKKGNGQDHATIEPDTDPPLPHTFSDDKLAEEWVARYGDDWRYVLRWDRWYEWLNAGWVRDDNAKYFRMARNITREALTWPDAVLLNSIAAKNRVNNATMAAQMIRWVRVHERIVASVDQWDANTLMLGVPNGCIDLALCKSIEPDRGYYITKRTAVAPASGKPERWLAFLRQVTGDDDDVINYLHRFAGYCLTGETKEHALAFLYGTGANGKTTFVETLLHILGDYGLTTGMETLSESKSERHPAEIARLHGARMVSAEETSTGSRWNEGRIKRLTGGGKISARMLYENEFEFTPQCKFLLAGNHKPSLRADEAMKRRIHLIPFTVTIPEQDRDRDLSAKLREEAPQILAWMIDGCAAWRDYGLAPGERIRDASAAYIKNNDVLGDWLADRTEQDPGYGWFDGKALYADFGKWCDDQGETVWKRRTWSDAMIDKGYQDVRKHAGRGFAGIRLKLGPAEQYGQQCHVYPHGK